MKTVNERAPCPCGSGNSFTKCCKAIIDNDSASSPETLMRSRYSAYVLGCWDYLHTSWHPDTRPSSVSPTSTDWLGLSIVKSSSDCVEFIAGFKEGSKIMLLHESSRFQQVGGHWRYLDGKCEISEAGRNTPCPCNSGLKTKRCCGKS
ncbi:hypothetical protein D8Y20_04255 [Mariprofundus sp. EBB-1]|uniref:YchJ family protein n=1 Tax=Mariprofundus sp. EBB-1 TaxID=2650971 RepID=UPI000EF190B0|nr:YchJ family metal-binding protein [Mariprofundus sp. EBB-1]RLL54105.1 hypothetical protein D8Y20_04255 [Mariprofundus sp. EBB-1]